MQLTLLRHGQTDGNLKHQYVGRTDDSLCEVGIAAAQKAASYFASAPMPACVYSSPLARAVQTARICFPDADIRPIDGFREMDFGLFEGLSYDDVMANSALAPLYTAWVNNPHEQACPEGETYDGFVTRTTNAFEKLITTCAARKEEDVVIVAHGGTIMAVLSTYDEAGGNYYDYQVKNCDGFTAQIDISPDGGIVLRNVKRLAR